MAIANADGSIVLSTKVDTSGINKGMSQMQGKATSLTKTFSKLGAAIASAFAIQKIIQFSNEAGQLATQTEASVQRLVDIYGSASDSVGDFIDTNARALGMSKSAAASFSSVYGNLFSVWADQATNAELTNRYLNMTAVVASKTGRTVEDVQERVRSGLLGNTEAIEDLGVFVNVKTIEMTDAFQRMADGKSWEQLDAYTQQQIRSMAILEQATAKYGNEVADTSATTRNRYKAAYEDFQTSWGNIVNTVLLPVLKIVTQIFDVVATGLNAFSGKSEEIIKTTKTQETGSKKTAENIKKQEKNQIGLNKAAQKSLASFDQINTISKESGGVDSGSVANEVDVPDFSLEDFGLGQSGFDGGAIVQQISQTLFAIMLIIELTMVAIGLILIFTGHIGWGIGFIIAGAGLLSVTIASASDFGYDGIIQMITTIMGIAGGALLALGIILLSIGGIVGKGVAIGMIVAGGALLVSSVVAQAALAPEDVGAWLSLIMGIAGGALLALGIILCMAGSLPIGVGMIIAGSVALVSAVALNFDSVKNSITGWVAAIMAIVGAAALVIGIILCATGVGVTLGIALIVAGAASLVTPVALNFNAIVDWVKKAWKAVKNFWKRKIAPIFTAKWWKNLAIKCANGFIAGFEGMINGIISGFESMLNWIIKQLNKISVKIPEGVPGIGGKTFGFDIKQVEFKKISIPRLAKGAVIPGNKEFLAVLGDQPAGQTNVEAPLDTIVEAFNIALKNGGSQVQDNRPIILQIDGREIARATRKGNASLGSQTVFGGFANAY